MHQGARMRFTIAALTSMIAAAPAIPTPDAFGALGTYAPVTILGIVLFVVVTKIWPDMCRTFAEANAKRDEAFAVASAKKDKAFTDVLSQIMDRQHTDSKELSQTLAELRTSCVAYQAKRA
jgi:hypothetical protein